ncbi:response regulator [Paenibacillus koleovorans]|uniref:response regulator n=1 Tax=Paenibacillus koleovorans TaxID=121608 RepID=UPI000FDA29EB|nr:response regulator [Paenibacillus koleovorans]
MLKLIIVDDERATREKLIEGMDWSKLKIQVLGEAKDGIEGLELAKSHKPDLILMDVRMPKMNGIESATEILKLNPDCKIIFLSGYTDKEYLKSAIQLKAVDYIEKPIDLNELFTVLQKSASECMAEKNKKLKDSWIHNKLEQSLVLLQQELSLAIIRKNVDQAELKKRFDDIVVGVQLHDNFRCLVLKYNFHKLSTGEGSDHFCNEKTLSLIYKKFEENSISCMAGVMDRTHVIIHVFGKTAEHSAILKRVIQLIQAENNQLYAFEGTVTAGVGVAVRGVEHVYKSYQNAQKALEKSFLLEYGGIIFYDEQAQANQEFHSDEIVQKLTACYNDADKAAAVELVQGLVRIFKEKADEYSITTVKGIFLQIMLKVISIAKENNMAIGIKWKDMEVQWAELLNSYTMDEIAAFIIDKLEVLFAHTQEQKGKSLKVKMAIEYIREHYAEAISVVEIAAYLDIRSTYLSTLFKKETGTTLSEYIESIRMERAKELLKDGHLRINEIAEMLGYNNANYFASVFNKVVGTYPSEYRRK